ncbi:MAG: pyridoxamine 5'-phosphate oxidase family protein [Cyanobacteria bacterium Co-bin13]|nr:pyridoxamine 5'-phosphate oxidase family protein [Cyanobacteria bacterium Co-bin13]
MGKLYSEITPELRAWVEQQQIFFVATAPASAGHVNCSPKGTDSLRVLGPQEVAYLDLTGSGVETIAHLQENGRIVIMLCAFEGPPKIVRFHGLGRVYPLGTADFDHYLQHFDAIPGARAIIHVQVTRISDSCGNGVPLYAFQGERRIIEPWAEKKGEAGLEQYRQLKNSRSLDQLPGL